MNDTNFLSQYTEAKLDLDEQDLLLNDDAYVLISRENMHNITRGVHCNEYKVVRQEGILDAACVLVEPSHHTPIQIIQKPNSVTMETPMRGVGALFVLFPDRVTPYVYVFDERSPEFNKPISFNLKQGDIMCWVAFDPTYPMVFSEICIPTYSSDRFGDVDENDERVNILRRLVESAIKNGGIEI